MRSLHHRGHKTLSVRIWCVPRSVNNHEHANIDKGSDISLSEKKCEQQILLRSVRPVIMDPWVQVLAQNPGDLDKQMSHAARI